MSLTSDESTLFSSSFADPDLEECFGILSQQSSTRQGLLRTQFRGEAQQHVLRSHRHIIQQLGMMVKHLHSIRTSLDICSRSSQSAAQHGSASASEMGVIVDDYLHLTSQKQRVTQKQTLLLCVQNKFLLSGEECEILSGGRQHIDSNFFDTLAKATQKYEDCQVLLVDEFARTGNQLMELNSLVIDQAFERLYLWTQHELSLISMESPSIGQNLRKALQVLATRTMFFEECLTTFSESRQRTLLISFENALVGTFNNLSVQKPIDLQAHDPPRYVGDMLAWLHSSTVGEMESLEGLFFSCEHGSISQGIAVAHGGEHWESGAEGTRLLKTLVDRNLGAVCKALVARVNQIITSQDEIVLTYRIAVTSTFYTSVFSRLVLPQSVLVGTLERIEMASYSRFHELLAQESAQLKLTQPAVDDELTVPSFYVDGLARLRELISIYQTSPVPESQREHDFATALSSAIDPQISHITTLADLLTTPSRQIFEINCLKLAEEALRAETFTNAKANEISDRITQQMEDLTSYVYTWFLTESALGDLKTEDSLTSLTSDDIYNTSLALDAFLPDALERAYGQIGALKSPSIVSRIISAAVTLFVGRFAEIESRILLENSVEHARSIFPRSTEDVALVLR